MARRRQPTRLIISFIGKQDIGFIGSIGDDMSPIVRVLGRLDYLTPRIPPSRTRLLLLDDDRAGQTQRQGFCEQLQELLPGLGLGALELVRQPIDLPDGPTDLNALYEQTWAVIPTYGEACADEYVFHITSGVPAMGLTLLLAAECLPLAQAIILETSREQGVCEVRPPYVLAERERRAGESRRLPRLTKAACKTLQADTVIDDPQVGAAYAALYKAANTSKPPAPRIIVQGPVGSGKWHACEQFAIWRNGRGLRWLAGNKPPDMATANDNATLLIRHLDRWSSHELQQLTELAAQYPDLAIAATLRTDCVPAAPPLARASDGLRAAILVELPALGVRTDVVALGEALARRQGIFDGKLRKRLQYDFLTDVYVRNLHDLATLLATAAATSAGKHPERAAYQRVQATDAAHAQLQDALQTLAGFEFGPGRELEQVLKAIRTSVVAKLYAEGRNQAAIGKALGMSQSRVSEVLKHPVELSSRSGDEDALR